MKTSLRARLSKHRRILRRTVSAIQMPAWRYDFNRYRRMTTSALCNEYRLMRRACFGGNLFAGNARTALELICFVLLVERDVTEIENAPFQATPVRPWRVESIPAR